jgi:hypothetical protein
MRNLTVTAFSLCAALLAACSDSSGPVKVGPLATIAIKSGGDNQTALAGTVVPGPIILTPTDDQGRTIPGQSATFAVVAGGGTIANTTGTVNSDGTITAPAWTLGKSAVPQQLQATINGKTAVIKATVRTSYTIDLRFFGNTPADDKTLFTNAANRIRGAVVGQLPPVNGGGADPAGCGATGVAPLTSSDIIDGVIIYASIDSIDAKGDTTNGNILAESGPCYIRSDTDFRTVIGIMKFDSADIKQIEGSGNLQEVITHEMMHVLGFGVFWDSTGLNLLINDGTKDVAYTGAGGIAGCQAVGGSSICGSSVPVEGTQGGPGTIGSHWRESTFCNELMTGFLNTGSNPLSVMSIRSLEDIGYTVNAASADPYNIQTNCPTSKPLLNFRAAGGGVGAASKPLVWEKPLAHRPRVMPSMGGNQIQGSSR